MSAQPAASRLYGESAMTPISVRIATGAWALIEYGLEPPLIEAYGLAIPSWLAAVGVLMNGTPALADASFATSISLPPPTPKTIEAFVRLIAPMTWFTTASVDSLTITWSTFKPAFTTDFATGSPARG